MDALLQIFPKDNFYLLALVLGFPLLGAFVNGVFGNRLGKPAVTTMALFAIGVSFLAGLATFLVVAAMPQTETHAARVTWDVWHWLSVEFTHPSVGAREVPIHIAFSVDALSAVMLMVVTGIGFLIHLYSTKYMAEDPSYARFFTYLNLFIFSMLLLILGDNLAVLFIGWEGVGLCSYLLIGFWFGEEANASAGKKAFIANRIGDFGLLVAMAMLIYYGGSLRWSGIDAIAPTLGREVTLWPIGAPLAEAALKAHASTLIALALFLGCAGKSAQIPLYVWLPDAMAGPTPVSALIHAATMVTAGVYLMCRMSAVFVMAPMAMIIVATIGAVTALLAASIAVVQNDIKKVLAYSTVSQLGYMFMATGVGAFGAGLFHVVTHAFFKGCLFLGAGSVIHAMHARIHDHDASQDMRNMGGLRKYMPITHITFLASCLAIAGLPFLTSGFYSKEAILYSVWFTNDLTGLPGAGMSELLYVWPAWWGDLLFALGMVGAVLTAFYMFRLYLGIFFADFRGWTIVPGFKGGGHDSHHHGAGEALEGPEPKESPWPMTVPLIVLGILSLVGGFVSTHFPVHIDLFERFIEPVFGESPDGVLVSEHSDWMQWATLGVGSTTFLIGVSLAFVFYGSGRGRIPERMRRAMPGLYRLVYDKWRVDEFYQATILGAIDALATFFAWFDKWVVDGIVAKLPAGIVASAGAGLRRLQTGRVQAYAGFMVAGMLALGWYLLAANATAERSDNHLQGAYSVEAGGGMGYRYRWDENGDGTPEDREFGTRRGLDFNLEPGERRLIILEVQSPLGGVDVQEFEFMRPERFRALGAAPSNGPVLAEGVAR